MSLPTHTKSPPSMAKFLPFVLELFGHSYLFVRRYTAKHPYINLIEEDICTEHRKDIIHVLP
jgi:hypothetical protein